jgi:hypothetical protein
MKNILGFSFVNRLSYRNLRYTNHNLRHGTIPSISGVQGYMVGHQFFTKTVVIFTQAIFLTFHSCDVKTINRHYDFHELYLNSNTFR